MGGERMLNPIMHIEMEDGGVVENVLKKVEEVMQDERK